MDPDNVRAIQEGVVNALLEAEKEAEATKQAIKRKIAQAAVVDFQSRTLPEKLRIDPNDPEDVVSMFIFTMLPGCSFDNITHYIHKCIESLTCSLILYFGFPSYSSKRLTVLPCWFIDCIALGVEFCHF